MKDILHYAHCVKFTIGQLDQHPFSAYESREAEVNFRPVEFEGEKEWIVEYQGKIIAREETLGMACASACYALMNKSRDDACHAFERVNQCKCGSDLIPPSEMCGPCSLNYHSQ